MEIPWAMGCSWRSVTSSSQFDCGLVSLGETSSLSDVSGMMLINGLLPDRVFLDCDCHGLCVDVHLPTLVGGIDNLDLVHGPAFFFAEFRVYGFSRYGCQCRLNGLVHRNIRAVCQFLIGLEQGPGRGAANQAGDE